MTETAEKNNPVTFPAGPRADARVRAMARQILAAARALRAAGMLDAVTLSAEYGAAFDWLVVTRHDASIALADLHAVLVPFRTATVQPLVRSRR